MNHFRLSFFGILVVFSLSACGTVTHTVFYQINNLGKIEEKTMDRVLWENEIAPDENFKKSIILQNDLASYHLIQIRGSEEHRQHEYHDVAFFLQSGNGLMFLGDKSFRVKQGAVVFIKHGTPYHFMNGGMVPASAIAIYSPPFDGKDDIIVPEKKQEKEK